MNNNNDILEILHRIEEKATLAGKNVLTLTDVAALTGLSKSHLYKLTSKKAIPHYRPSGKAVYFDRKEVEDWLRRGRVESNEAVNAEAERMAFKVSGRAAL